MAAFEIVDFIILKILLAQQKENLEFRNIVKFSGKILENMENINIIL